MSQKSMQIAIGGLFSALCLLLMFFTGIVPFATYALPALSGAMLIAVVEENGRKTAVLVYVSVALLSVLIAPDREAALMFIAFFGYYPILQGVLGRIRSVVVRYVIKLLLFNAAMISGYFIAAYVFGLGDLLEGMGDFGRYSAVVLLGSGNLLFIAYDYLLSRYTLLYRYWFRRKFLRR